MRRWGSCSCCKSPEENNTEDVSLSQISWLLRMQFPKRDGNQYEKLRKWQSWGLFTFYSECDHRPAHTSNPIKLILHKAPEKQPKSPKHHQSPCFKLDFAGWGDAPFSRYPRRRYSCSSSVWQPWFRWNFGRQFSVVFNVFWILQSIYNVTAHIDVTIDKWLKWRRLTVRLSHLSENSPSFIAQISPNSRARCSVITPI